MIPFDCRRCLLFMVFLVSLAWRAAYAIDDSAGTAGAQFMDLGLGSARAMGLGRSYVALADGSDALLWNPAGLAQTREREVVYSHLSYVQDLEAPGYVAYAHPMGRTVWGFNAAYLSMSGFDVRDEEGRPLDSSAVVVRNSFATIGVARSFWFEKLFFGAAVKGIHEDLYVSKYQTLVADLGVLVKPSPKVTFGLSLLNYGAAPSRAAKSARLGAAYRIAEFFRLSLELQKPSDDGWLTRAGLEFTLPEEYLEVGQISFRLGYYDTNRMGQNLEPSGLVESLKLSKVSGLSLGLGLYSSQILGYGMGLDYAFVPFGALGTIDQISFKFKF